MVLTDVHDLVEVRVGSPVGTSDHSAIFMDVVLEQSIPHLVCRQIVYLKNSVDWKLVIGGVKGLHWKGILRSLCSLSTLNDALLGGILNRVPMRTIVVTTGNKPWFYDQWVLAHRAKQGAYRVWSRSRMQAD